MGRNHKIYCLIEKDTEDIRYIGLTKHSLSHRLRTHFEDKRINHRTNWLKSLSERPAIILLEDNLTLAEANERERYYISYYKSVGCDLVNGTVGGDGTKGFTPSQELRELWSKQRTGRKQSDECKLKKSVALKNRYFSPEHREKISNANKGVKFSEERKAKLRVPHNVSEEGKLALKKARELHPPQMKGKTHSVEAKLKQSLAKIGKVSPRKGAILSEETKEKLRDANIGKKQSEATKLKRSLAMKGRICKPMTQEAKDNISKAQIGRKQSPETVEKRRQTLIQVWAKKRNVDSQLPQEVCFPD